MFNCIKMDLYRMFRMKSFYVVGIILAVATFFTTSMSVLAYNMMKEEIEQNPQAYEQEISSDEEPVNLGMDVTIPTRPGEMVTVYDQVYANLQGKFIALFMVIFAVLFSASDLSSGYIKNIVGQMKKRGKLILSKAVALFIYTILTMLFYLFIQAVAQAICFDEFQMGSIKDLAAYSAIQTLLHYALLLICMAITIITRSKVFSMTFAVLFCMNVMVILYSTVDKIVARLGIEAFNMLQYTVTGRMALLEMAPSAEGCVKALVVAVLFGLVMIVLSSQIFRKRDI